MSCNDKLSNIKKMYDFVHRLFKMIRFMGRCMSYLNVMLRGFLPKILQVGFKKKQT